MQVLDQHIGTVGEIKIELVGGKLQLSVEGDLDLVGQLEKLKAGHETGFMGQAINLIEGAIQKVN